jgi:hypothetical protein
MDLLIHRPLVDYVGTAIRYGEAEILSVLLEHGTVILVNGDGDPLRYDDGSTVLNELLQYGSSRDSNVPHETKVSIARILRGACQDGSCNCNVPAHVPGICHQAAGGSLSQ